MGEDQIFEQVEKIVIRIMTRSKIPGISLAILSGDKVVYAKGFGARNLKRNLPATQNTLYGIGSCTKSFTALAVMQLVQEGKLELNDPVEKYVPFKLKAKEQPITIHNLLSHSSGIPGLGIGKILSTRLLSLSSMNQYYDPPPICSWDDFFSHVNGASEEIINKPGEKYRYFNSGYTILGKIIETLSNKSFEEYIREKILKSLKMDRSTFLKEEFENDEDTMIAHLSFAGNKKSRIPFSKFLYPPMGLVSSVKELANYLLLYHNNGSFEDKQILNQSLLNEMLKIQIERPSTLKEGKFGYGYGWDIEENFYGHKLISHNGAIVVSAARLAFIPDKNIGIAIACNTANYAQLTLIVHLILTAMLGEDPTKDFPITKSARKLTMLTGLYESYGRFMRVEISRELGVFYFKEVPGENKLPLILDNIENFQFSMPNPSVPDHPIPVEFKVESPQNIYLDLGNTILHKKKPL
ncbi:MAG: serine hydrolase domain-containing protein [Promethearchaeota archaeon]